MRHDRFGEGAAVTGAVRVPGGGRGSKPQIPRIVPPALAQTLKAYGGMALQGAFYSYHFDLNLAANATGVFTQRILADSDFLALNMTGTLGPDVSRAGGNLSDLTIRLSTDSDGRGMSTGQIQLDHMCGDAQDPAYFPVPWWIQSNDVILCEATNTTGAVVVCRVYVNGIRLAKRDGPLIPRKPFIHEIGVLTPAGAGTGRGAGFIVTHGLAPWACLALTGQSTLGAAGIWDFRITDDARGRVYSTADLHSQAFLRDAREKFWLPFPVTFEANSTITIDTVNLVAGAQTTTHYLHGVEMFDFQGASAHEVDLALAFAGQIG